MNGWNTRLAVMHTLLTVRTVVYSKRIVFGLAVSYTHNDPSSESISCFVVFSAVCDVHCTVLQHALAKMPSCVNR